MNMRTSEVRPAWATGVELHQTAVDCVQVVGDVERPLALRGLSVDALEWLRQLDGVRSWRAQITEAQAEVCAVLMPRCSSISSLRPTFSSTSGRQLRLRGFPTQLWSEPVNSAGRLPRWFLVQRQLGALPKPRDGDDWRVLAERLGDEIGSAPTIVALTALGGCRRA